MKNTWYIEGKILSKLLEIQANKKVSFLRQNAKMARIVNFKACFPTKINELVPINSNGSF